MGDHTRIARGKPLEVMAGAEDVGGYAEKYPHKMRVE